jgi:hypothetical protein
VQRVAWDVMNVWTMTELTPDELERVIGGADDSFGRCGPGNALPILGNVRTPECQAHDQQVRDAQAQGSSYLGAQWQARGGLWPAAKSWARETLG